MTETITFGTTNVTPKRILVNSQTLTITFESKSTYQDVKIMLSNTDNTKVITYTRESEGQTPYTLDYKGYTSLDQTIGVGENEYTITLNKPNLEDQLKTLENENAVLKNKLEAERAINDQQDMCIVEVLQQITLNAN